MNLSLRRLRFVPLVSMKFSILVALLMSSVAFAADERKPVSTANEVAVIKTSQGEMVVQFWTDAAPETIANFKKLARSGFYNGTIFHRIVKGFVVQGGMGHTRPDKAAHAADRWVRELKGEFREDVKHTRGVVSMARNDDPNSASTSFFLMLGDAPHLDGKYTAFAQILGGIEVLEAFEKEEVDGETPKRRLEIIEARIE